MRQYAPLVAVALGIFSSRGPAALADEAGPANNIALSDAIRLALAHNPDFRSTGYDVVAAQGAVTQASVPQNPSIFIYTYGTPIKPASAPVPNEFGFTWTIPVGGKISAATDAAKASLSATKSTRQAARQALILNVQTAFVSLLLAQAQLGFSLKDQAGFHKELTLNELRYKDGRIAYGDLLKLRIQTVTIDDTVREDIEAVESARADLFHVVGENVLAPDFKIQGELSSTGAPPAMTLEALLSKALANRPDYLSLLDQEKSAKASLLLAQRIPIPDISILADYNRPNSDGVTGSGTYDLSLSVPIPMFDQNRGNIMEAEAAYKKSDLAEESLRTQIRSDLVKALQEWQAASALRTAYENGTVRDANESLEITRHAYDLGTNSLLDFLDAESSYRQTESAWRASIARVELALDNIQYITGEATP